MTQLKRTYLKNDSYAKRRSEIDKSDQEVNKKNKMSSLKRKKSANGTPGKETK